MSIELLTDAWRWWAVPGALMGLWLLIPRIYILSVILYMAHSDEDTIVPARHRLGTLIGGAAFMLAALFAGAVIPMATDGRFVGFTKDALLFKYVIATAWLLFGSGAWIIAICLSPQWRILSLASTACFGAAWFATVATVGIAM